MDKNTVRNRVMNAAANMRGLLSALNRIAVGSGVEKKADKPARKKEKKKTQPGAKHVVNPVFLGRRVLAMSPAVYRRMHRGAVKTVPNYLTPSPKPKWRNRYEPKLDS